MQEHLHGGAADADGEEPLHDQGIGDELQGDDGDGESEIAEDKCFHWRHTICKLLKKH